MVISGKAMMTFCKNPLNYALYRVIPDRWKGMSKDQLESIRDIQKQQLKEKEVIQLKSKYKCNTIVSHIH